MQNLKVAEIKLEIFGLHFLHTKDAEVFLFLEYKKNAGIHNF